MSVRASIPISALVAGGAMLSVVVAAEKTITRAQLPAAVERTVAAQSQGATIKKFSTEMEGGRRIYEVQLVLRGRTRDISMNQGGEILEVEDEVVLAALPPAVQAGLRTSAGTGTIRKVESLTKKGTLVAYEAIVQTGKKQREVQVGPDGKRLTRPE